MNSAQLRAIATGLETGSATSTTANDIDAGWLLRAARAAEAGAGKTANPAIAANEYGYLQRIAEALEFKAGITPTGYNATRKGLQKRIADAASAIRAATYGGDDTNRIVLATSGITFGVLGLTAAKLTRTSAVSAYPPTVSFTRPIDWADTPTMYAVMQWSLDPTFATFTETTTPPQITAAVTTYNFGLSAIVSGVYYMRLGAWTGTRPALNFSNIVGVGDAVAPAITSSAAPSGTQFIASSLALTANKSAYWAIVGGADMAQFSISGSTLSWAAQSTTASLTVQVQATSYFAVASTVQTITLTVAANTASAFSFTAVTNATLNTAYTSNTITIAGITGGASLPVTVTGATYSKNGAAFVSTAGTAVNGDTFALKETSSVGNNGTITGTLTVGTTSSNYLVSTPVVLSTTSAWNGADKASGITISGAGNLTAAGNAVAFYAVRGTASKATGKRQIEMTVGSIGNGSNTGIGFANATAVLTNYIGVDTNGTTYFNTGFVGYNGSAATYATFIAGAVIGAVWDQAAATVAYYKNGVLQGTVATANLNATLFPSFCDQGGGNGTLNTGGTTFAFPIAGAQAWDV